MTSYNTNINTIGYNLFNRSTNFPVIIPCSLDTVTAQFYAHIPVTPENFVFANNDVILYFVNDGSNIQVDWGDGNTETLAGNANGTFYTHSYEQTGGSYIVSVYINNCTALSLDGDDCTTSLSTIPIEGLGFGMLATLRHPGKATIDLTTLPFYDAINISGMPVVALDYGTYDYLSSITCNNSTLATVTAASSNFANMIFCNLTRCALTTDSVDTILGLLANGLKDNGLCNLINQQPPAIPSQDGIANADALSARGWYVQIDT